MDDSAFMYDEVIESYYEDAEVKSYDEKKLFQQILIKRKQSAKHKFFIFYLHFY